MALRRVSDWLTDRDLRMAPEKTEAVMLMGRSACPPVSFLADGVSIVPSRTIKYLGVTIDGSLSFGPHVEGVAAKADGLISSLMRLMPRTHGPRTSKRRLLASVANSVVLYASPVWAGAMEVARYRDRLLRTQRKLAIRVSAAYRTTSTAAVMVIAGMAPIHLLVSERSLGWGAPEVARRDARIRTRELWQSEWSNGTKGEWTRRLIPRLDPWLDRVHGELSYHLTQVLSGHGCFGAYLFEIGKRDTDACDYCGDRDDVRHTFFECPRFEEARMKIYRRTGPLYPVTMVGVMLSSEDHWLLVSDLASRIMSIKERDGSR